MVGEVYGTERAKHSIRWQLYQGAPSPVDNTNDDYETATIVLATAVGIVLIAGIGYGISQISTGNSYNPVRNIYDRM